MVHNAIQTLHIQPIMKSGKRKCIRLINNIAALALIMAWRRSGDMPLSEPMLTQFTDAYMRH